ncbi:MAG: hypothetical protein WA988_20425 [Candidatus Nanopelagicales bacterium]
MTTTTRRQVSHPFHAGIAAASWYTAGQLIYIALRVLIIVSIGQVMRWTDPDDAVAFWLLLIGGMAAIFLVGKLAKRALRTAWSEVPGAFGWRYLSRGDDLEASPTSLIDLGWVVAGATVWALGGAYLVTMQDVDLTLRAVVVAGFGAWIVGSAVAFIVVDWRKSQGVQGIVRTYSPVLVDGAAWVAAGTVAAAGDSLRIGMLLGVGAVAFVVTALIVARIVAHDSLFRS